MICRARALVFAALLVLIPISHVQAASDLSQTAADAGLRFEPVATDLAFPMGMVALPDGSLLVATSSSLSGNFYDSTGEILRLIDTDDDGSFDDRQVAASDLAGSLVAIARYESTVMVISAAGGAEGIIFLQAGDSWDDPLTQVGRLRLRFTGAMHQSYGLAVRPSPDSADAFDLFFNIGAGGNDTDGANAGMGGLLSGSLSPSTVYMTTVQPGQDSVSLSLPILIASGLRNASALLIDPASGDLIIGENGIDGFTDPIVAFSADEINIVPADQIGERVVDFGFPDEFTEMDSGQTTGQETAAAVFRPLDGSEAEGVAGIALIPSAFPEPFAGGMLAGFHGQFDLTGLENEENPLRFVNLTTGEQIDVVSNDAVDIGHLDSMVATGDVVYIADFCNGSMLNSPACGVIYRLSTTWESNF